MKRTLTLTLTLALALALILALTQLLPTHLVVADEAPLRLCHLVRRAGQG